MMADSIRALDVEHLLTALWHLAESPEALLSVQLYQYEWDSLVLPATEQKDSFSAMVAASQFREQERVFKKKLHRLFKLIPWDSESTFESLDDYPPYPHPEWTKGDQPHLLSEEILPPLDILPPDWDGIF